MLTGTQRDFQLVYERIMEMRGLSSKRQAEQWLKQQGLTPHHLDATIPTALHANVPHIGSASDLRGGFY
jgi:hypothetical protein